MYYPNNTEQDELLSEIRKIDEEIKQQDFAEKRSFNILLTSIAAVFGTFITLNSVISKVTVENIPTAIMLIMTILTSFSGFGAYLNKKWGDAASCITAFYSTIIITSYNPNHYSFFVMLADAICLFVFANAYSIGGYVFFSCFAILKTLYFFILYPQPRNLTEVIAQIISFMLIGLHPILISKIGMLLRISKKNELKSRILALQNEELIKEWQKHFQPSKKVGEINTVNEDKVYTSAYE